MTSKNQPCFHFTQQKKKKKKPTNEFEEKVKHVYTHKKKQKTKNKKCPNQKFKNKTQKTILFFFTLL